MPRDFSQIEAAAQYIANSVTADETTSFPPGYISGFNVTLAKDYTVTISAGAAYVAGRGVKLENDHLLAGSDWVVPRLDSPQHYYIYLDKTGSIRVDLVAPTFNNGYCYYEQPDYGWRAVGKIFVKGNDIIYAVRQVERTGSTVTVAPSGFTGQADYYCTGVDDDILINSAISYINSAYWGGTVNLLGGTFVTSATINIVYANITLSGQGRGTVIDSHQSQTSVSSAIYIGMAGVSNSRVQNILLNVRNSNLSYGIEVNSTGTIYNVMIEGVTFYTGSTNSTSCYGVAINNSTEVSILDCIIDGNNIATNNAGIGIALLSGQTIISNCHIKNIRGIDSYAAGIFISGGNGNIISNNQITNIVSTSSIRSAYGIYVSGDYDLISNNKIEQIANTVGTNAYGIYLTSSTSTKIDSNYCLNNGADTGIANENQNNFYDLGTDTQVYSNSWQSPVSGEPEQGQFHWLLTAPTAGWWVSAYATATIVSVTNSYLPVGAKTVEMFVRLQNAYGYLVTSKYSGCTCTGAYLNLTARHDFTGYAMGTRVPIAIDSDRKFYFRSWDLLGATGEASAVITFSPVGYTS